MAFKFIVLLAVVSAASAGVIVEQQSGWQQPAHGWQAQASHGWQQPSHGWQQPAAHGWQQPATVIKTVQPTVVKAIQPALVKQIVHEAPANYEFNYEVHDQHTGDIKRQHEKAENGHVSGQYSLVDPDGYRRIVTYTADDHHGFQANVQREPWVESHGHVHKVVASPVITKVVQPQITKVIQPATIQKVVAAPVHGWQQPQAAHGWQAPQVSHGWKAPVPQPWQSAQYIQPNPHAAANPWG